MSGSTIGLTLGNGFAGSYARQPDIIINTRCNADTSDITFGRAVVIDSLSGGVKLPATDTTAAAFAGIATQQVQSAVTSFPGADNAGVYKPDAPVPVLQRGRINVICSNGTAKRYGKVYLRVVEADNKHIGDLEAAADGSNSVELTNCQWGSTADSSGCAELVILYAINA